MTINKKAGHPAPAFLLEKTEVTQLEFNNYLKATIYKNRKNWPPKPPVQPQAAAVNVSWLEAQGYCRHFGKRLPSQAEWEQAAGPLAYPWGDAPLTGKKANFCDVQCNPPWHDLLSNDGNSRQAPVGSYPEGASKEGVLDLAGNVWEWTSTRFGGGEMPRKGEQYSTEEFQQEMAIKGGSYGSKPDQLKTKETQPSPMTFKNAHVGFRCAQDLP